jgi:hypothetical protein
VQCAYRGDVDATLSAHAHQCQPAQDHRVGVRRSDW